MTCKFIKCSLFLKLIELYTYKGEFYIVQIISQQTCFKKCFKLLEPEENFPFRWFARRRQTDTSNFQKSRPITYSPKIP